MSTSDKFLKNYYKESGVDTMDNKVLLTEEEINKKVGEMISTIDATNISLDDKDKVVLDASKKALETHNEDDIALAIEEATRIKNSGNSYGNQLLDSLNNMLSVYANETYDEYKIKKEADRIVNDRLGAIEAGNAFREDSDKLSTTAIRKALETHDEDDIALAIEEATTIKNSGDARGDQLLDALNQVMVSYTKNTYEDYLTKKETDRIVNDRVSAVEASNFSLADNEKLSTAAIRKALETHDAVDIAEAIKEAEVIKNSGNSRGEEILNSLKQMMVSYNNITVEELEQQQEANRIINDRVNAVEASNFSLADNEKLSTTAIRKAAETNSAVDIAEAIKEAEVIKNSGNSNGEEIISALNTLSNLNNKLSEAEMRKMLEPHNSDTISQEVAESMVKEAPIPEPVIEETQVQQPVEEPVVENVEAINQAQEPVAENIVSALIQMMSEKQAGGNEVTREINGKLYTTEESASLDDMLVKYSNDIFAQYKDQKEEALAKDELKTAKYLFKLTRGNLYNGTSPKLDSTVQKIGDKNKEFDKLLAKKDTLDWNNAHEVMDWFSELTPYLNLHALSLPVGLANAEFASMDKYLLNIFEEKGYTTNSVNVTNINDFYKNTISLQLQELEEYGFIPSEYNSLSDEDKKLNSEKSMDTALYNRYCEELKNEYADIEEYENSITLYNERLENKNKAHDEAIQELEAKIKGDPTNQDLIDKKKFLEVEQEVINEKYNERFDLIDKRIAEHESKAEELNLKLDELEDKLGYNKDKDNEEEYLDDDFLDQIELGETDEKDNKVNPINKITNIGKNLYEKVTSIEYKKVLKKALDFVKEHKVATVLTTGAAIALASIIKATSGNVEAESIPEPSLNAEESIQDSNVAEEVQEASTPTAEAQQDVVEETVVEEAATPSFETQTTDALSSVQNGETQVYSNVYDASTQTNGQAAYLSSWENAVPGDVYATINGSMQQVTPETAQNLDNYEVVYESNGTPIGAVHVDNTAEQESGISR